MVLQSSRSPWVQSNGKSERLTSCESRTISNLPSPEEGVLHSIHTSQRKVEQPVLGSLVPILPIVPECAIRVGGRISLNALQVEAAIIDAVTVFSSKSDTEGGLAWKKLVSLREGDKITTYLSV